MEQFGIENAELLTRGWTAELMPRVRHHQCHTDGTMWHWRCRIAHMRQNGRTDAENSVSSMPHWLGWNNVALKIPNRSSDAERQNWCQELGILNALTWMEQRSVEDTESLMLRRKERAKESWRLKENYTILYTLPMFASYLSLVETLFYIWSRT